MFRNCINNKMFRNCIVGNISQVFIFANGNEHTSKKNIKKFFCSLFVSMVYGVCPRGGFKIGGTRVKGKLHYILLVNSPLNLFKKIFL